MSRRCDICGRSSAAGRSITRSGSPKHKGGIGLHTGGITARRFNPNVQKLRIVVDGTVKKTRVCSRCLKAGKVQRPFARPSQILRAREKDAARLAAEAEAARLAAEADAVADAERIAAEAEEAANEAAEEASYQERQAHRRQKHGGRDEVPDEASVMGAELTKEHEPPKKPAGPSTEQKSE